MYMYFTCARQKAYQNAILYPHSPPSSKTHLLSHDFWLQTTNSSHKCICICWELVSSPLAELVEVEAIPRQPSSSTCSVSKAGPLQFSVCVQVSPNIKYYRTRRYLSHTMAIASLQTAHHLCVYTGTGCTCINGPCTNALLPVLLCTQKLIQGHFAYQMLSTLYNMYCSIC